MPKAIDRRGETFGFLTAISMPYIPQGKRVSCTVFRCECGTELTLNTSNVTRGLTRSCGCVRQQLKNEKAGWDGRSRTRLYRIWQKMRQRCQLPTDPKYKWYGGRGIRVTDGWSTFDAFRDWSLEHGYDDSLELDRIDNDGPYSPDNCRWVTHLTNMRNTSRRVALTVNGETKGLSEWGEDPRYEATASTIQMRLRNGWDVEQAVTAPVAFRNQKERATCRNGHPWLPENIGRRTDAKGRESQFCRVCKRAADQRLAAKKREAAAS